MGGAGEGARLDCQQQEPALIVGGNACTLHILASAYEGFEESSGLDVQTLSPPGCRLPSLPPGSNVVPHTWIKLRPTQAATQCHPNRVSPGPPPLPNPTRDACCRDWIQDLKLELRNTAGSVETTLTFDQVKDSYTFTLEPCAPGTGGAGCDACPRGSFSRGGNASVPNPPCEACPVGVTTLVEGAKSADACGALSARSVGRDAHASQTRARLMHALQVL